MEGGAANIVTLTLPYTDRLIRATPPIQKRNKKWPYEAGQKIKFPWAFSGQEMAYDAAAMHEALLKEDGFYNSTNFDNPAGSGLGIGHGSSPFAGAIHPSWFNDVDEEIENAREQWIKNWIIRSMNKPIDGIRNGGRYQVNEVLMLQEGIRDYFNRKKLQKEAFSILDERLNKFIPLVFKSNKTGKEQNISQDVKNVFETYYFIPFNRSTIAEFFDSMFEHMRKNPQTISSLSKEDFGNIFPNDEYGIIYFIFNKILKQYPILNDTVIKDFKEGQPDAWFEKIFKKPYTETDKNIFGRNSKPLSSEDFEKSESNDEDEEIKEIEAAAPEAIVFKDKKSNKAKKDKSKSILSKQEEEIVPSEIQKELDKKLLDVIGLNISGFSIVNNVSKDYAKWKEDFNSKLLKYKFKPLSEITVEDFLVNLLSGAKKENSITGFYEDAKSDGLVKSLSDCFDEPDINDFVNAFIVIRGKITNFAEVFSYVKYDIVLNKQAINEAGLGSVLGTVAKNIGSNIANPFKSVKKTTDAFVQKHEVTRVFDRKLLDAIKGNLKDQENNPIPTNEFENKARNVFSKYGLKPIRMSTIGDFYKDIYERFAHDLKKLSHMDDEISYKEEFPDDEELIIFQTFNALMNIPELKKITEDLKKGEGSKWFYSLFDFDDKPAQIKQDDLLTQEDIEAFSRVFNSNKPADVNQRAKWLADPKMRGKLQAWYNRDDAEEEVEEESEKGKKSAKLLSQEEIAAWKPVQVHSVKWDYLMFDTIMKALIKDNSNKKLIDFWRSIKVGLTDAKAQNQIAKIKSYFSDIDKTVKQTVVAESTKYEFIGFINEIENYIAMRGGLTINPKNIKEWVKAAKTDIIKIIPLLCKLQVNAVGNDENRLSLVSKNIINIMSESNNYTQKIIRKYSSEQPSTAAPEAAKPEPQTTAQATTPKESIIGNVTGRNRSQKPQQAPAKSKIV